MCSRSFARSLWCRRRSWTRRGEVATIKRCRVGIDVQCRLSVHSSVSCVCCSRSLPTWMQCEEGGGGGIQRRARQARDDSQLKRSSRCSSSAHSLTLPSRQSQRCSMLISDVRHAVVWLCVCVLLPLLPYPVAAVPACRLLSGNSVSTLACDADEVIVGGGARCEMGDGGFYVSVNTCTQHRRRRREEGTRTERERELQSTAHMAAIDRDEYSQFVMIHLLFCSVIVGSHSL